VTSQRQVQLVSACHTVTTSSEPGSEAVGYSGITVARIEDDVTVEQTWVPLGACPSFADDEALITAWQAALTWSRDQTRTHP
jgi:diaminopimelate decarboxylase